MKNAKTHINGELFIHKVLWSCCEIHSEAANKANSEKNGDICYELSAMLFAYLSYEAYINFLGEKVAPDAWEDERNFFNRDPYRGIGGKLKKICEECNITHPDKQRRPYQTIIELNELRSFLVHGKIDKYDKTVKHERGKEPKLFDNNLYRYATQEKMKMAIEDVEKIAKYLHPCLKEKIHSSFYGDDPFGGIIEHCSADTASIT